MNQSTNRPTPTATDEKKTAVTAVVQAWSQKWREIRKKRGTSRTRAKTSFVHSPRNDPQSWKDPQIGPKMIPTPKSSSYFFLLTPKWSPRN